MAAMNLPSGDQRGEKNSLEPGTEDALGPDINDLNRLFVLNISVGAERQRVSIRRYNLPWRSQETSYIT